MHKKKKNIPRAQALAPINHLCPCRSSGVRVVVSVVAVIAGGAGGVVVLVLAVLVVVVVVVWRDSGREGHVRRWGREGLMMWQFVIVYKHVCKLCKHAGHAGISKIIKNTIF